MEHELLHAALGQWSYLFEYAPTSATPSSELFLVPAELTALLDHVEHARLTQLAALCRQASRVLHVLDTWSLNGDAALTESGTISGVSPLSRAVARTLSSYVIAQIYRAFSEEATFSERTTAGVLMALDQLTALKSLFDLLLEIDRNARQHHDFQISRSVAALVSRAWQLLQLSPTDWARIVVQKWQSLYLRQLVYWMSYATLPNLGMVFDFFVVDSQAHVKDVNHRVWDRYVIVKERVPEMFSPRLAETILFMGKASKVLQLTGKVTARDDVSLATRLEHVFSTTAWQSIDLELKIDELRHELAQKMIAMLFKEYNLQGYFWTLKEFFMLTNGEFYLGFMNGAQKLLSGPLTANHENDLNLVFQDLSQKLITQHDERVVQALRVTVGAEGELKLNYSAPWPINLLLNSNILDKYGKIFTFYWNLKYVQVRLDQIWSERRVLRPADKKAVTSAAQRRVNLLRSQMSYVLDSLLSYLQVDVVEAQFEHAIDRMKDPNADFDQVVRLHQDYLVTVMQQSFFAAPALLRAIDGLRHVCLAFCDMISREDEQQFEHLFTDFQQRVRLLFTLLSGMYRQAPYLTKLLQTLDYNQHYSSRIAQF
jgi:hypothetical protein